MAGGDVSVKTKLLHVNSVRTFGSVRQVLPRPPGFNPTLDPRLVKRLHRERLLAASYNNTGGQFANTRDNGARGSGRSSHGNQINSHRDTHHQGGGSSRTHLHRSDGGIDGKRGVKTQQGDRNNTSDSSSDLHIRSNVDSRSRSIISNHSNDWISATHQNTGSEFRHRDGENRLDAVSGDTRVNQVDLTNERGDSPNGSSRSNIADSPIDSNIADRPVNDAPVAKKNKPEKRKITHWQGEWPFTIFKNIIIY